LLINNASGYKATEDSKSVVFGDDKIAAAYNDLVSELSDIAAQQDKLDKDIASYQAYALEKIRASSDQR